MIADVTLVQIRILEYIFMWHRLLGKASVFSWRNYFSPWLILGRKLSLRHHKCLFGDFFFLPRVGPERKQFDRASQQMYSGGTIYLPKVAQGGNNSLKHYCIGLLKEWFSISKLPRWGNNSSGNHGKCLPRISTFLLGVALGKKCILVASQQMSLEELFSSRKLIRGGKQFLWASL